MRNKRKGMKTVQCRTGCGNEMKISEDSRSGVCWRCVNESMKNPSKSLEEVDPENEQQ